MQRFSRSSYTSVLTIVAFSTERYLAICQPIHSYTTSNPRTALRVICVLWCVSLLSATPFAVYTKINYVTHPQDSTHQIEESAFCAMLDHAVPSNWPMYELSAFLFFLGPMLIIVILYVRMGVTIQSRMIKFPGETKHLDSRTKPIIRMLAAVVVTFFLCWAPFHMQRLFYLYGKDTANYIKVNEWAYYITGCFYYFSCTVNPVLYNVMSVKYRVAFRKTLCCGPLGSSSTREASTYRDTTVVYVNTHLDHRRSSNNIGDLRRPKSFSRHSRSSEIPNNVLEKMTHAISRQNSSSSARGGVQEQSSTRNCDALLDPYKNNGKCQICSSNQRHKCDKISDLIVSVTHSPNGKTNSYSTTETWPKFLLRATKKTISASGDSSHMAEPCLRDTHLCSQQETCM